MAVKNVGAAGSPQISSKSIDQSSSKKLEGIGPMDTGGRSAGPGQLKSVDVNVSDKAKARSAEQKLAKDIAMNAPDVREDKVAAIKTKIANGTYQVDSGKIADGMMREAIMEHLAKDGV
jgi:negative regulator of flagellin synthesis FlgM